MKHFISLLKVIFVVSLTVLCVTFILDLGAATEQLVPGSVEIIDKWVGASFFITVGIAILLCFYDEGKRIGGVEALSHWSEEEEEKEEANGTE